MSCHARKTSFCLIPHPIGRREQIEITKVSFLQDKFIQGQICSQNLCSLMHNATLET